MFNWRAAVVNRPVFEAFRSRPELRASLQTAFTRIMAFYGFNTEYEVEDVTLSRSSHHLQAFRTWVVRLDQYVTAQIWLKEFQLLIDSSNHLRITRIIRSLRVLGLEQNALAFYDAIQQVNEDFPKRISPRSMMYWKRAATRPLYLAPDVDDDDAMTGPKFLQDFGHETKKVEGEPTTSQEPETQTVDSQKGTGKSTAAEVIVKSMQLRRVKALSDSDGKRSYQRRSFEIFTSRARIAYTPFQARIRP